MWLSVSVVRCNGEREEERVIEGGEGERGREGEGEAFLGTGVEGGGVRKGGMIEGGEMIQEGRQVWQARRVETSDSEGVPGCQNTEQRPQTPL